MSNSLGGFYFLFLKRRKAAFIIMTVMLLGWSFAYSFQPYVLKIIIDGIVSFSGDRSGIWGVVLTPLLIYILLNICVDVSLRIYEWVKLKVIPQMKADMREKMFDYAMQHSYQYFQNQLAGSLSNKILDMVRAFENIILCILDLFFPIFVNFLIVVGILWSVHWFFGAFIIGWFIIYNMVLMGFGRVCLRYADEQSEANSALSGKIVDVFRNMTAVRMFSRVPFEKKYFDRYQKEEVAKSEKLLRHMWYTHIFQAIATTSMVCLMLFFVINGWRDGWATVGDFALVTQSTIELAMYSWWMGSQFPLFFKELGVAKQALRLISVPHEVVDAPDAKPLKIERGEIRFVNVTFHYIPQRNLFRRKNITIAPGEKVGLVGFSGSGKTTFVNLILRYYNLESGKILIDGQDISKVTQQSLREQIAVIPQDPYLFHRSLMENIRYGRTQATDEEVIEAAKLAHCHEFISEIPEGYQALVGESGIKLSGGQRQRIAIARALLKRAPILILDEATSALDSATERKIQESLYQLMRNKTTIVVAHRLSTLLHMNRILVFKNGQIVESGSHSELLIANKHYAQLWKHQQQGFLPSEGQTRALAPISKKLTALTITSGNV